MRRMWQRLRDLTIGPWDREIRGFVQDPTSRGCCRRSASWVKLPSHAFASCETDSVWGVPASDWLTRRLPRNHSNTSVS